MIEGTIYCVDLTSNDDVSNGFKKPKKEVTFSDYQKAISGLIRFINTTDLRYRFYGIISNESISHGKLSDIHIHTLVQDFGDKNSDGSLICDLIIKYWVKKGYGGINGTGAGQSIKILKDNGKLLYNLNQKAKKAIYKYHGVDKISMAAFRRMILQEYPPCREDWLTRWNRNSRRIQKQRAKNYMRLGKFICNEFIPSVTKNSNNPILIAEMETIQVLMAAALEDIPAQKK